MNYSQTIPYTYKLDQPDLEYSPNSAISNMRYTGNTGFIGQTASSCKPQSVSDQMIATVSNLQNLISCLEALESKLFGAKPTEGSAGNPPYSSLEGNINESRNLSNRANNLAQNLFDRI